MNETDSTTRATFDHLIDRAGLTVPKEQRAELLPTYVDLCKQLELVHRPRAADAEPSNVFRLLQIGTQR